MRRLMLAALVLILAALGDARAQSVERRVALVIGNSAYTSFTPLKNPANDARSISDALGAVGFEVITGIDLDRDGMENAVAELEQKAAGAAVALVFYSGHGIAVDGVNYLVPVDATLDSKAQFARRMISADWLLNDVLGEGDRVNIVMLDACRDDPFIKRSVATRGIVAGGLSEMRARSGTYVAFATAPGKVASDGAGRNSPFTRAMLNHLRTPGMEIDLLLKKVRREVVDETQGEQVPWNNSALLGEFYFVAPGPNPSGPQVATPATPSAPPVVVASVERTPAEPVPSAAASSATAPIVSAEELQQEALQSVEQNVVGSVAARRKVQQALGLLGYKVGGADGRFGPATRKALATFQAANRLDRTGYVDRLTLTLLESKVALLPPEPQPVRPERPRPAPVAAPAPEPAPAQAVATDLPAKPAVAAPPASPFTMGECQAGGGVAWAGVRILTAQQCADLGGQFSAF